MAAMGLSVGVRLRPLTSVVNGTVVARPVRTTLAHGDAVVFTVTVRQGSSLMGHRVLAKRLRAHGGPAQGGARELDDVERTRYSGRADGVDVIL
jgi:predicted metalloprotease